MKCGDYIRITTDNSIGVFVSEIKPSDSNINAYLIFTKDGLKLIEPKFVNPFVCAYGDIVCIIVDSVFYDNDIYSEDLLETLKLPDDRTEIYPVIPKELTEFKLSLKL